MAIALVGIVLAGSTLVGSTFAESMLVGIALAVSTLAGSGPASGSTDDDQRHAHPRTRAPAVDPLDRIRS